MVLLPEDVLWPVKAEEVDLVARYRAVARVVVYLVPIAGTCKLFTLPGAPRVASKQKSRWICTELVRLTLACPP